MCKAVAHDNWDDWYEYAIQTAEMNGICNSEWSCGEPMVQFDKPHPYPKAEKLYYQSDPFYGEPSGNFVTSIDGDTWLDLWKAADDILGGCGDKHHTFIEMFVQLDDGDLVLQTGS